jgi:hypothetical protein
MENGELLKAIKEIMDAQQEKKDVNIKEMREEIKCGQAEMRTTVSAIEEKMEAVIHSLRAWRIFYIYKQTVYKFY